MTTMRSTKLRSAIMGILASHDEPLGVPRLQELLKEHDMTPHKTSLYRNLEVMSTEGEVHEVLLDATNVHYELQKSHHHHALCNNCRTVSCIAHEALEKSIGYLEEVAQKTGFSSSEHHVVLHGLCAPCRKKSA